MTSAIITAAYNVGAALVAILFLLFKEHFIEDWRYTMIGFSIFSIILFICWLIFSHDFEPTITWKHPNYFVYKLLIESKEILQVNVNIKLDRKFFSKNLRGTTKNFPSHFFETNQLNRHVEKTDILVKGLNKVSLD